MEGEEMSTKRRVLMSVVCGARVTGVEQMD